MALGDQVVAETGSLLPGMQGGGLAVGRPIGGGGDAEMQKQMLLMMQGLQSQLQGLQQSQEQMASEHKRLGRPRGGGGGGDDDDDDDQKTLAAYKRALAKVIGSLNAGKTPAVEAYAERDLHLFRLSDEDIRAEYEAYTRMYLDDATAAPVRGGTALAPRTHTHTHTSPPPPPPPPAQRPTPRVRCTCHLTAGGGGGCTPAASARRGMADTPPAPTLPRAAPRALSRCAAWPR